MVLRYAAAATVIAVLLGTAPASAAQLKPEVRAARAELVNVSNMSQFRAEAIETAAIRPASPSTERSQAGALVAAEPSRSVGVSVFDFLTRFPI